MKESCGKVEYDKVNGPYWCGGVAKFFFKESQAPKNFISVELGGYTSRGLEVCGEDDNRVGVLLIRLPDDCRVVPLSEESIQVLLRALKEMLEYVRKTKMEAGGKYCAE